MLARKYWRLAAVVIAACLVGAVVLAYTLPPQFRSTVLLAPARHAGAEGSMGGGGMSGGALSLLRGLQMPQENLTAEAIAILQSRPFVERFIEKHDLMPVLFEKRWNATEKRWNGEAPSLEDGYLLFTRSSLKVRMEEETGFVKVQIFSGTAPVAANWANFLVRDLNDEIRERVVTEGNADLKYLYARMGETLMPEVRSGIANLIRERTQEVMLATNRESYAFRVLEDALPSKYRYFPKRSLIMIAGFIVGLLLTLGIVAIREALVANSPA